MQAGRLRFYLGSHQPHWLWHAQVPLMVSARQPARRARRPLLPQATCCWALDSGGFTELSLHGRWTLPAVHYAEQAARLADQLGGLDFAAPQDWMCEPAILARTRLTVAEHQQRTVANYLELRTLAPWLPWMPVLQGWRLDDYLACVALYQRAGVALASLPLVGLGSVCRRQASRQVAAIARTLAALGLWLHGFGVKTGGLAGYADALCSADSLAWSYHARRSEPLAGCGSHRNCANCLRFALAWRARLLGELERRPRQLHLDLPWPAADALAGAAAGTRDGGR